MRKEKEPKPAAKPAEKGAAMYVGPSIAGAVTANTVYTAIPKKAKDMIGQLPIMARLFISPENYVREEKNLEQGTGIVSEAYKETVKKWKGARQ